MTRNHLIRRRSGWVKSWIAIIGILFGFLTAHTQISSPNPVTGKRELVLITQEREVQIGEEVYVSLQRESGGLYRNQDINAYVAKVGHKIAATSDRPNLPFEFVVIDNDIPNAWAVPGGKIAINKGLLKVLDSEAELASVLAHEIAHATARHTAQRIERDMVLENTAYVDIVVNPLSIINPTSNINEEVREMKYSRDAESEADRYGIEYMARAGYNVKAAPTVHQKLKAFFADIEGEESALEALYLSHPSDDERFEKSSSIIKDYPEGGFDGEEAYQRIIKNQVS